MSTRARSLWLGAALVAAAGVGPSCATGPGAEFIKAGDDALRAGRPSDALAAWDQAEEEGAPAKTLRARRDEAQSQLAEEKVQEADRLEAEGDHSGAMAMLLEARELDPDSEALAEALVRHGEAWLGRARALAEDDQRAAAIRALDRLQVVYPEMPGLANTRSVLVSEWTEILLNRARDVANQDRPAIALMNWAILAALNPEEPFFGAELDPLRQRLLGSLSVRSALFLGAMNAQVGLDPDVERLRDQMASALSNGELALTGIAWVERSYDDPGPSVTVSAVGEILSNDVERGPGIYRVLKSTRDIPNPERVQVDDRIKEIEARLTEIGRQMDKYEVSLKHSEGPSRTKMTEALTRSQAEYDRLTAEAYDLRQRRGTLPEIVSEPTYTEYTIEDEVHSHRVEVTIEVKVATGDGAALGPSYLVGVGEEKDTLRIGDPSRGIPDDPLVFAKTDDELRQIAVADALYKARRVIAVIPRQAAQQWLAHAQRSERAGDTDEAIRAYVHHVLLSPEAPAEEAVSFLVSQGVPSPSVLRGERPALP